MILPSGGNSMRHGSGKINYGQEGDYCMDITVEERVDKVEIALERFIDEMGDFKDEMRAFRDKIDRYIYESKEDSRRFQREMQTFKENAERDRTTFQREMQTFKENAERDNRIMNKRWGEISNKMGTMVEDIVAPSIPRIVKERFNIEIVHSFIVRIKRVKGLAEKEWDAIAVSADIVFLNSTKTTLKSHDVDGFLEDIKVFRDYFPEYKDKGIIGVLASLYIDKSVIRHAEKNGLLVLGIGEEIMEILNSTGFEPMRF
jgi:hypothetical protein